MNDKELQDSIVRVLRKNAESIRQPKIKTFKVRTVAILDRKQADWSRNIRPQAQPGEIDPNQASEVTRIAPNVLEVVTTGGERIRFEVL